MRKYVFLCAACGGMSSLLGVLFLAVYFLLRSYTSSLAYFETVPTYVPATMLLSTGVVVMCLARRRNRYSFLMKLCGCACLASAALCVLVTVATTVVHMSRLQSLSQCHYHQRSQTCTCFSALPLPLLPLDAPPGPPPPPAPQPGDTAEDGGARYVFNGIPDCDVIHGALYSCLRAMFGLSVVGILVCIFSGMLVYQLFSHEKKKMYWEQLELRCRYLYRRQQPHSQPPGHGHGQGHPSGHGHALGGGPAAHHPLHPAHPAHHCACSCCEDCRCGDLHTPPPTIPWELMDSRYWAPGRVGNLYSPNPEEHHQAAPAPTPAAPTAWSWRRLPWGRSASGGRTATGAGPTRTAGDALCIRPRTASSPDSQYGFSPPGADLNHALGQLGHLGRDPSVGPYLLSQVYPAPQPHPRPFAPGGPMGPMGPAEMAGMGMPVPMPLAVPMPMQMADDLGPQFYLWGPPPPYMSNPASAANSPARRDPAAASPAPAPAASPLQLQQQQQQQQQLACKQHSLHCTRAQAQAQVDVSVAAVAVADRSLSPADDPGNTSALDSLSSPEKSVPRKKRKKTPSGGDGHHEVLVDGEQQSQPDSPESPTPNSQVALAMGRKTKKRSDAPLPPGARHSRYLLRNSSSGRRGSQRPSSADSCCVERSPCCSRAGDASDDVDTEGYSYPRLKFPPPAPAASAAATSTPSSDSQAILAAFDNQAFQDGAVDAPSAGPVKTLTLGPQGPLVCKKRPADPSESEIYFGDDSSCCNVSEQHSSLTYDESVDRPGRAFKLVHAHHPHAHGHAHGHAQQRSMDGGGLPLPRPVHRPSASTLSDSATVTMRTPAAGTPGADGDPVYRLHPIDTDLDARQRQGLAQLAQASVRQRMPLPLPLPLPLPHPLPGRPEDRDRLSGSLAPDAQYESIADSNVYTYISPLPLVHHRSASSHSPEGQGTPSLASLSPIRPPSCTSNPKPTPTRRQFKPSCDSPHKSRPSSDEEDNVANSQRDKPVESLAPGADPSSSSGSTSTSTSSGRMAAGTSPDERPGIDV